MSACRLFAGLCVAAWIAAGTLVAQSVGQPGQPGGLTLDQVLTAALAQHPLVEAARARVDAARGSLRTANTPPNPMVGYATEGGRFPGQGNNPFFGPERSVFMSLPLDSFVQRRQRVARADADLRVSESEMDAAERDVARAVTAAYYRVAVGQAAVAAANEKRGAVDRLVEYLRVRVAQGASPEAELIRTEVERDQAALDVTFAEVDLTRAQAELRPFLGARASVTDIRVAADLGASASAALPPLDALVERASSQRPELAVARARVASAEADLALQRRSGLRDFGIDFGLKRMNGVNTMMASAGVAIPLFDRHHGEIDRATSERTAAQRDLEWIDRQIAADVTGAYEVVRRLSEQLARFENTFVARAEESARIALATYQEGAAPLLHALDATHTLAASRLSYSRLVFAHRESLAMLRLMAGDDLRSPAPAVTPPTSSTGRPTVSLQNGVRQ